MTEEKEVVNESNGEENKEKVTEDNTAELEEAIIRQVEYYFGDLNLTRDKFLREQTKLDEGWVPLDVLIRFNRLAQLSKDLEVIANALNKSTSGLLEVSEDNSKVRRSPEMPVPEMNEERRKEVQSRTVYAKGFPKDAVLDDLLKYFKDQGDVENVVMRRYPDKATKKRLFKGSVFATFKTREGAEKFMETKGIKYGETELITNWQDAYLEIKQKEYAERKEQKEKKVKDKQAIKEQPKTDFKLPTGTVLHFSECPESLKREHLKEALTALGGAEVAYIDFKSGDKEGWVRFATENGAVEIFPKITDGKLNIENTDVVFKLLEGDEEKAYLEKSVEEMVKRRKNQKNFNNRNKSFKHYKGKGNKRKQGQHSDEPPRKIRADDS